MTSAELIQKRQNGRFYTEGNPFVLDPFRQWAKKIGLAEKKVLEPFAGANNIIRALQQEGFAKEFESFDIEPQDSNVLFMDTLAEFPTGYEVSITNPPWLAKNSATRRGLNFPNTIHDDLYKYALEKCLAYCEYVAAIIPATFLQSSFPVNRLDSVILLHDQSMFLDTDNPVCLALFAPQTSNVKVYHDNDFIGELEELKNLLPKPRMNQRLIFNHPEGELGFIAIDGTKAPSIRFISGWELGNYPIVHTSRMITRIKSDVAIEDDLIKELNARIDEFREQTKDVFLTPFKGLRKDGMYRRRMDYSLARHFINTYA